MPRTKAIAKVYLSPPRNVARSVDSKWLWRSTAATWQIIRSKPKPSAGRSRHVELNSKGKKKHAGKRKQERNKRKKTSAKPLLLR